MKPVPSKDEQKRYADFRQSLLRAGLVKRFPTRRTDDNGIRPRISVTGKPVSETLIEERGK